jgi:mRNA-degrading endonuclease YafQ of YafQ-DinJ toxin-antitoxin module
MGLFLENPKHPSLHIKKMKGHPEIWEGRITRDYRFTFKVVENTYFLRRIGTHDILKTP